ncbi:MAG: hypothetical protein DIU56_015940 [Pseudomonadota bacterium]|jgi:hypothetical protein|nr:MAG: hypothetical protein DIU56_03605 [Pseudomonadota bacterium]
MEGTERRAPGRGPSRPAGTPDPDPRKQPPEHDPTTPEPDDPRRHEPMRDPPAHPARDAAGWQAWSDEDDDEPQDPANRILFDENRMPG